MVMFFALPCRRADHTGGGATPLPCDPARVWHPVGVNATVHERRPRVSRRHSRRRSRSSRVPFILLGFLVVVAAGAIVAAYAYDHARRDRIAPGVRIGGVDVGGLSTAAARRRIVARAVMPRRRTITVHAHGRTFTLPPSRSRVTADVDGVLHRALVDSRRGWLGRRVADGLSHKRVDESLSLPIHYAPGVVAKLTARVADAVRRSPVDASVHPSASGLSVHDSHTGRALNASALKHKLAAALTSARRPPTITATTHRVAPSVSTGDLADKYPAYIVIDRSAHVLRFYEHLKPASTYPIAVGRQGLETPAGLYDVQWKETNPSWHVPNSSWAGALAGKTIPPGPDDPIKARWMAFNGGAGIHGIDPSEYGSIGHDASHGCVRMRIPDVISLYARTPVHTPVFVA
jgi:lipoprotein-anchoring transpeptidase ErfK/SrfK